MWIHDLVIERVEYDEGTIDEAGQPTPGTPTTTTTVGLVQPRTQRGGGEVDDYRSAGTEVADHIIFMPVDTDLRTSDAILFDDGRYNVVGIRRFRYGALAHLEVEANLVTSVPTTAAVGS